MAEKREMKECNTFLGGKFMFESLETLFELQKQGTMKRTASALRISESAVSKRVAALESQYGIKLIRKIGRNVVLTIEAKEMIERVKPILFDLKVALRPQKAGQEKAILRFGVSESILSSWGASSFEAIFQNTNIEVQYHSHRSPLVIERVESGAYDLGLCSGKVHNPRALISDSIAPEELVLVAQSPKALKSKNKQLILIETGSATWNSIKNDANIRDLKVAKRVESFFAVCQLARAGHGVGLVPKGVALALSTPKDCMKSLSPKIFRPVQIVYKKSFLEQDIFVSLLETLRKVEQG